MAKLITAPFKAVTSILNPSVPKPKPIKPPEPPPPMPIADDDEIMRLRRRQIAQRQNSSGRASTILTPEGGGKLGG